MFIELDFSILNGIRNKTPQQDEKPATGQNTAFDGHTDNDKAFRHLQAKQADHRRAVEEYTTYQENIQRAGTLREQILKGVREGVGPTALFLQAAECIALMTGDRIFYDQIRGDVLTVWGQGLQDEEALTLKLQEVEDRLQMLVKSLKAEDLQGADKERLQKAAAAHRQKKKDIETQLKQQDEGAKA